jgi:hypothetical protein
MIVLLCNVHYYFIIPTVIQLPFNFSQGHSIAPFSLGHSMDSLTMPVETKLMMKFLSLSTAVLSVRKFTVSNAKILVFQNFRAQQFQIVLLVASSSHNLDISFDETMEGDCRDSSSSNPTLSGHDDIININMLTIISSNIHQMLQTDLRLIEEFQKVVDDHDSFKQEVCSELDAIYHLLSPSQVSSVLSPNIMPNIMASLKQN